MKKVVLAVFAIGVILASCGKELKEVSKNKKS